MRALSDGIVAKAERNKVFREGWIGGMHAFAIDGWEPISSYHRHCDECLVRHVRVERGGEVVEVEQYYHRYVVAMLIDERFDMALDIEPLLPADLRPGGAGKDGEDEGEQTAAIRLLRRVKRTFGWLEVVVADGLYPNGPFLTVVKQLRMSAVIIAKKDGDEPLKEALALWGNKPAAASDRRRGSQGADGAVGLSRPADAQHLRRSHPRGACAHHLNRAAPKTPTAHGAWWSPAWPPVA